MVKIGAHFFLGKFCLSSRIYFVSVLLLASVERCFVSRIWDFFMITDIVECCKFLVKKIYIYILYLGWIFQLPFIKYGDCERENNIFELGL